MPLEPLLLGCANPAAVHVLEDWEEGGPEDVKYSEIQGLDLVTLNYHLEDSSLRNWNLQSSHEMIFWKNPNAFFFNLTPDGAEFKYMFLN